MERSDSISESDLEKELRSRFGEEVLDRLFQKKIKEALNKNSDKGMATINQTLHETTSDTTNLYPNVITDGEHGGNQGARVVGIVQENGSAVQIVEQREIIQNGSGNCEDGTNARNVRTWAGIVAGRDEIWKKGSMGGEAVSKKKLRFIQPAEKDGKPVVHLKSENFVNVQKRYEKMVIGGFVGRRLAFQYVKECLKSA